MQSPTLSELQTSEGLSAEALSAWKSFLRAHTLVTRALERELMSQQRLPLAEYDVLVQLAATPDGRLRMAQLADRVLLSRSGLTRLVERLESAQLVRREVCPSDARGSFAVLTPAGRQRLELAAGDHLRSVQAHFGKVLDSDRMLSLGAALEQIAAANMSEAGAGCPEAEAACPREEMADG